MRSTISELDEALKLARETLDGYRELLMQANPVAPRSIEDCNYPEVPRSVIVARALLALAEQRTAEQTWRACRRRIEGDKDVSEDRSYWSIAFIGSSSGRSWLSDPDKGFYGNPEDRVRYASREAAMSALWMQRARKHREHHNHYYQIVRIRVRP